MKFNVGDKVMVPATVIQVFEDGHVAVATDRPLTEAGGPVRITLDATQIDPACAEDDSTDPIDEDEDEDLEDSSDSNDEEDEDTEE